MTEKPRTFEEWLESVDESVPPAADYGRSRSQDKRLRAQGKPEPAATPEREP